MESIDPATGRQLPSDAIQRILFIATTVHVYNIPPLASTKGYTAGTWTEDPKRHIFTVRLRVIETAIPQQNGEDKVKADLVLEDPSTGQLFAAAPYTTQAVVESALDSSRFFALRVQDPSGRKATLGIGFEERSEAFDFSVALQETRKALGWEGSAAVVGGAAAASGSAAKKAQAEDKKDYSLKEGETITVNLGGKFGRRNRPQGTTSAAEPASLSSFALPPPPSASSSKGGFSLPPPPSAQDKRKSVQEMGFDDGQFGEFA